VFSEDNDSLPEVFSPSPVTGSSLVKKKKKRIQMIPPTRSLMTLLATELLLFLLKILLITLHLLQLYQTLWAIMGFRVNPHHHS
jgi:hypothetical protein